MVPGGHLPRVPHRALAASPGRLTGLAALGRASPTWGGHGAPVVVVLVRRSRPASLCRPPSVPRLLVAQPLTTPGGGRFRLRRGPPVQLQREPQAWVVVRGRHGHGGLDQHDGHQVAQPSTTSGQGQKILSRGRVPRCVSTLRAQDDQALRAGGSQHRPAGQQGHQEREARDAAQDEQRHARHRQTPAEQHKATTPEASAPRSGSPSGRTRRAKERAPASHREERQAATPTKAAQLTPGGRRPSSSDTRSEASRITCETRAEGRPREPTAWGRGARGRFLGRPVSQESCGKVPIDRGDAFSWPHRGRLIGLDT